MSNTQLGLDDLKIVVQLIDVVSARGAIRGEEMMSVGALRTKFATIIEEAEKAAGQKGATETQTEDDGDE